MITIDYVEKVQNRIRNNSIIAGFYRNYKCDHIGTNDAILVRNQKILIAQNAERISSCGKVWETISYKNLNVDYVSRIHTCGDKFCAYCQSKVAYKRQQKFSPMLDNLSAGGKQMHHVVLTVPNCTLEDLPIYVDVLLKRSFPALIEYFKGKRKFKGFDFTKFRYVGCIRSLEVTFGRAHDFHPHLHCIFAFDDTSAFGESVHKNQYSFKKDHKDLTHEYQMYLFNDFEIALQKLWRLLFDSHLESERNKRYLASCAEVTPELKESYPTRTARITKARYDALKQGYDAVANDAKGRYHEVFKYAFKGLFKESDDYRPLFGQAEFNVLRDVLYGRRVIQGYGCFYGIPVDEDVCKVSPYAIVDVPAQFTQLPWRNTFNAKEDTVNDVHVEDIVFAKPSDHDVLLPFERFVKYGYTEDPNELRRFVTIYDPADVVCDAPSSYYEPKLLEFLNGFDQGVDGYVNIDKIHDGFFQKRRLFGRSDITSFLSDVEEFDQEEILVQNKPRIRTVKSFDPAVFCKLNGIDLPYSDKWLN